MESNRQLDLTLEHFARFHGRPLRVQISPDDPNESVVLLYGCLNLLQPNSHSSLGFEWRVENCLFFV